MIARTVRYLLLSTLLLVFTAGAVRASLKDDDYKGRLSALKTALALPDKDEPVDQARALEAISKFAELRDARVIKDLAKMISPVERWIDNAKEELDKATYKLEQVRIPEFERVEESIRRTGKAPDTILIKTRDALETLGKKQKQKAQVYNALLKIRDALYDGMETHLNSLGEAREEVWRSAMKDAVGSKDPAVRAAFCLALRRIPEPKAEEILLGVAEKEEDPAVLVAALDALAARHSVKGFDRLKQAMDDPNWEVQVAGIYGIAQYRDARTIPVLVERLKTAYGRVSGDIVDVLFDLTGKHLPDTATAWEAWWNKEGEKFMKRWSPDKGERRQAIEEINEASPEEIDIAAELAALSRTEPDAEMRQEIVECMAFHPSNYARSVQLKMLYDSSEEIRITAIRNLAHYRHLSVPEALMRLVPDADDRELEAIYLALQRLWGGKHEFDAQQNKESLYRWWASNETRVGPQFVRLGAKAVAAGDRETKDLEGRWQDRNFYGIRLVTDKVLFVVDISLSMEEPAKEGEEEKKITVAKRELKRAIQSLPSDATFGLVVFCATAEVWEDGMMKATADNKKRVVAYIESLETRAATNIYDTFEMVFQIGMPGSFVKSEGVPDTIYFVSDGAPTVGKYTNPDTILEHINRWNERRKVKIHSIGVGDDHDVDFLRKLADTQGGIYVAR